MKKQLLIFVFCFFLSVSIVYSTSFLTIWNPFTGTFDYYNVQADNLSYNLDCSLINFSGIIGSSEICDGLDALSNGTGVSPWIDNGTYVVLNSTFAPNIEMYGYIDMNENQLTNVGTLIVEGISTLYNATPATDDLYSLGNSTHWWNIIYVNNIYTKNIDTTNLSASYVNSSSIDSDEIDVSDNISVGGFTLKKDEHDNLAVVLI